MNDTERAEAAAKMVMDRYPGLKQRPQETSLDALAWETGSGLSYSAVFTELVKAARAAALDEAAEVAKAEGHKWHERWMDSDREESLVGRRYADYRDTALALASAIRALKEEEK